jgi:hypothetical protein
MLILQEKTERTEEGDSEAKKPGIRVHGFPASE